MKTITKKFIFSIASIVLVIILITTCTFAWFVMNKKSTTIEVGGNCDISVQGYILKYYEADDGSGKDVFISDTDRYPVNINTAESITGDANSLQGLDIKNYLKFVFIIKNNDSTNDCDISFRLSTFADKIFAYYDDYVNEYDTIKSSSTEDLFTKKDNVVTLAKQYNAKFSLYFDNFQYCIGDNYVNDVNKDFNNGIEMKDILVSESNPFLWKYSTGNKVLDKALKIGSNQTATLTFTIKTQQNSESINDYKNWMTKDFGRSYLSINKYDGSSYNSLSAQEKLTIDGYLNYFVNTEVNTIYTESTTAIQETKLLIDYMEFIGDTVPR